MNEYTLPFEIFHSAVQSLDREQLWTYRTDIPKELQDGCITITYRMVIITGHADKLNIVLFD